MNHINHPLLGRQIGEVYKWLCFLNYVILKSDKDLAGRLDDIQYILEAVSSNKDRDISETAQWWDRYYEDKNCNEYATNLIRNVRNAGRESRFRLEAHKRKALAFYFAEFRGLSISLRSARDSSEHHVSQGENKTLFLSVYAAVALRVFHLSKLLGPLVDEIARSYPDEVKRFSLRIITASESELNAYKELSQVALAPFATSSDSDKQAVENSESSASYIADLLDESEERVREQLNNFRAEMLDGYERSRNELIESLKSLSVNSHLQASHPLGGHAPADQGDSHPSNMTPLSRDQLFDELLRLRGQIYSDLTSRLDGFEHWHNILQKPLIAEICRSGCQSYDDFKKLPGFRSRIIQANNSFALKEQEEAYAQTIDQILSRLRKA